MKYKSVLFTSSFMAIGLTSNMVLGFASSYQQKPTIFQKIDNKNFLVYYRAWRDKEMKGVNTDIEDENWITMFDIPYGINYVNVFSYVPPGQEELAAPYFEKLKTDYAPYLHARGVKLIRGFDYGKLLEIDYKGDFPTDEEFEQHAQNLINELMIPWGLDGLDIDMESQPNSAQVAISDGVIKALSKLIGPKANNGTAFFYDTNGSYIQPFQNVADCFDLLAYQQYGSDSQRTKRAVDDYSPYINSDQFLPGLTFPEEKDLNRWFDQELPYENSHMYDVASYSYQNNLSGMFLYALDRDGRNYGQEDLNHIKPSNLMWTKTALLEANGVGLDLAKELAHHHLSRIRYSNEELDNNYATYAKEIDIAKNLLEVNMAILGKDYEFALNPNYDPILENQLKQFDHQPSLALVQEVRDFIKDHSSNLTELKIAYDNLVALLGSKEYTKSQLEKLTKTLHDKFQEVKNQK